MEPQRFEVARERLIGLAKIIVDERFLTQQLTKGEAAVGIDRTSRAQEIDQIVFRKRMNERSVQPTHRTKGFTDRLKRFFSFAFLPEPGHPAHKYAELFDHPKYVVLLHMIISLGRCMPTCA